MTTPAQIGKNVYRELLRRGRSNTNDIRNALRRIVDDKPGPQATAMLVTRIAISFGNIEALLSELEEFGRKNKETT